MHAGGPGFHLQQAQRETEAGRAGQGKERKGEAGRREERRV